MIGTCPNKNTVEWKNLAKQTGEELAELAFVANGYVIPIVPTIAEIKKGINYSKTKNSNTIGRFALKVRQYNAVNGTSHSFTTTPLYGDTVEITMHLNYLAVNVEAQRQRDAIREDSVRVADNSAAEEAFRTLYDIQPKPQAGKFEQKAEGYFDEEGNFKPFDDAEGDIDYLVPTASKEVQVVESLRRQKIDKDILSFRKQLAEAIDAGDKNLIYSIGEKINNLRNAIDGADRRVTLADKITTFEEITGNDENPGYAGVQLNEVELLLNKKDITFEDVAFARRTLDLWIAAGDFTGDANQHVILDPDEFKTPEIRELFQTLRNKAEALSSTLFSIEKALVVNTVRSYTDQTLTDDEIFADLKDLSKGVAMTRYFGRHNDAMAHTIASIVERANTVAKLAVNSIWKETEDLGRKAQKKSNNFQMYRQQSEDGNYTTRVVDRFSPEFYSERETLWKKAFRQVDANGRIKKDAEAIQQYFDWVNNNTVTFDVRALFPDTLGDDEVTDAKHLYTSVTFADKAKEEHIALLKRQLGEKGYEEFLSKQAKKIEKFRTERDIAYFTLQQSNLSLIEKDSRFEDWLKENSPYWGMEMLTNKNARKKGNSFYQPTGLKDYGVTIPKKENKGVPTKWYDKNFEKIEADEDLYNFYNFLRATVNDLNKSLPYSKRQLMKQGILPTMEKTFMELFSEKGITMGITPLWDKFKELQTTTDLSTNISGDINPRTGELAKDISVAFVHDHSPEVEDLVKIMRIKHEQTTGSFPNGEEMAQFRKEALNKIAGKQSWDLIRVLKAYSLTSLAYKHKAEIAPQVELIVRAFNARKEIETTRSNSSRTKWGENVSKEGLANWKSAMNYYLDTDFYSIGGRKVEGVSKTKLLSSEELAMKKELEELIANETDEDKIAELEEKIAELGKFRTVSASFDLMLKYMTYKNLGWNIGSAFSNLGFGFISNIIEASDGRLFTMPNFRRATLLTVNSVGRNISFNTWEGNNGNAVKIRSIMDNWHLMNTSVNELFQTSIESGASKLKRFGPMTLQERTEYLNYAPIMIATTLEFKAKDPEGNDTTLWDALDTTGKLKEGYTSDFDEVQLIQRIKRTIEMTHGDYNNALELKKTVSGRAISQFRTWMLEGFANRFEEQKPDWDLSYGMSETFVRKGRYKSYTKGQLTTAGAILGTTFLPGIGTAVGAGIGYLSGKFVGLKSEQSSIGDVLFTIKQLGRKLLYQKTQFDQAGYSKVDAANMRKNMTELYMLMGLAGITLLLRASIDDEEKKKDVKVTNFLINQMTRLQTDISFYTNPMEAEKLVQNIVPMMSLGQEAGQWFTDVAKLNNEDEEDDYFQAPSPFEGSSKVAIRSLKFVPFANAGLKVVSSGSQIFADK